MNTIKPFSKRFHFPIYYMVIFGLALLFCLPGGLYMLFAGIDSTVGLVLLGVSLFVIYLLYEFTKTIVVDQNGIALDSLLGEIRRFSWGEIAGMKKMSMFSPGIKVVNQAGEGIEISNILGNYDVIIEIIRRARKDLAERPVMSGRVGEAQPAALGNTDLTFKAEGWRWIITPLGSLVVIVMFIGMVVYSMGIYTIIMGVVMVIGIPIGLYNMMNEPVLLRIKGERMLVRFRSDLFRENIKTHAGNVKEICLNHHRTHTTHGTQASTDISIHFVDGGKVVIKNFEESDEEIYMRLCAWIEAYRK